MKRYKEFIKEGLLAAMKPKSEEDILKSLEKLSDNEKIEKIINYQLDYDLLPRDENGICVYDGYLKCFKNGLTVLPDNLTINGNFDCSHNKLEKLPDNLTVIGKIFCNDNKLEKLPNNLTINSHLYCNFNHLTELPDNLTVGGHLDCSWNELEKLPNNLTVGENLYCRDNKLKLTLPTSAKIGGTFYN